MSANFASGVASARKSSTPASWAMEAAVKGLSPVIITVRIPMERISANFSWIPSLTTSLSSMTPRITGPSATTRGVDPARDALHDGIEVGRDGPSLLAGPVLHRVSGALADLAPVEVETGHPCRR